MSATPSHTGKTRVFEAPNGELVRVEVTRHSDYAAQLDVHHDGRQYQYGIRSDGDVERIQVLEDRMRLHGVADPEWIDDALDMFDIPGGLV